MNQKHALVAGGAGFIGSHLCELLLEKGYKVTAADNLVTSHRRNIEHLFGENFNWLDINIANPHYLNGHFDEIYNLASPASPLDFLTMPQFILETGAFGHRNMLEHARQNGARVLLASTSEVYGDPLVHPQPETYFGNVNSVGPRSCYDEAKRFAEAITMVYLREYKVPTRIARIFNTYGPRMRLNDGRIIPNFCVQSLRKESLTVHGSGEQTRSYCYVKDLVDGLYRLMQSDETMPVNIGNINELSVLDSAKIINEITGNKAPIVFEPGRPDDPKQRRPDISKARAVLGWEPKVSFQQGLAETLDYFRKWV